MRNKQEEGVEGAAVGCGASGSGVAVDILTPGDTAQQRVVSGDSVQIEAIIDVSTWQRGCLPVSSFTASPSPRIACCHAPRTEGHPEANPLLTPLPKRSVARAQGGRGKGLSAVAVAVAVTLSLAEATRRVAITKWHAPWRNIDPMQGGQPLKWEAQLDIVR